jgi:hypothetical protein
MKAIEISAKTDKRGHLKLDYPLELKNGNVRVIILMEENHNAEKDEEKWLKSISSNPAFDFLKEEPEIYSVTDGIPIND